MLRKLIKALLPPIFILAYRYLVNLFYQNRLFDGDDMLFKEALASSRTYAEYGCGKSTVYALKKSSANVISVDTSIEWIRHVKTKINASQTRLQIYHANLGSVGQWGRPLDYSKSNEFSSYTDYIWKQAVKPDLVLIDGRFRVCCFLTSLLHADPGTIIIFDDYVGRPQYHIIEKYVKRFKECGRQCLFVTPNKEQLNLSELNQDIAAFKFVMD